ncbi:MAG: hypothetical protein D6805_08625 [Planctomycetota bacterium]|nr:MAG: hypothetical protein D6805_08625 [Planctomycetota bacterium]
MIVVCPQCQQQFDIDEAKIPPKRVKSKCLNCGNWIYLREEEGELTPSPLQLGLQALQEKKWQQAQKYFQQTLHQQPQLKKQIAQEYQQIAQEYQQHQESSQALLTLKHALELLEDQPALWELKGKIHLSNQEYTEAEHAFQRALNTTSPPPESSYLLLGELYHLLKKSEQEEKLYKQALTKSPQSAPLLLKFAQVALHNGHFTPAISAAKKAKKLHKNHKNIQQFCQKLPAIEAFAKGVKLFKKKKFQQAAQIFEQVQDPLNTEAVFHYYCGVCQCMLKNYTQAIAHLEKYLHLDAHGPKTDKAILFLKKTIQEFKGLEVHIHLTDAQHCHLLVETQPPAAQLYLNNKPLGQSPLDLNNAPMGEHLLKTVYNSQEIEIPLVLNSGIAYRVEIDLKTKDYQIQPSLDYEVVEN